MRTNENYLKSCLNVDPLWGADLLYVCEHRWGSLQFSSLEIEELLAGVVAAVNKVAVFSKRTGVLWWVFTWMDSVCTPSVHGLASSKATHPF